MAQSSLGFCLILSVPVAYTTSVLFNSESGVLQFLKAAANMDEVCVVCVPLWYVAISYVVCVHVVDTTCIMSMHGWMRV